VRRQQLRKSVDELLRSLDRLFGFGAANANVVANRTVGHRLETVCPRQKSREASINTWFFLGEAREFAANAIVAFRRLSGAFKK
jgi:hypothetical protein